MVKYLVSTAPVTVITDFMTLGVSEDAAASEANEVGDVGVADVTRVLDVKEEAYGCVVS